MAAEAGIRALCECSPAPALVSGGQTGPHHSATPPESQATQSPFTDATALEAWEARPLGREASVVSGNTDRHCGTRPSLRT